MAIVVCKALVGATIIYVEARTDEDAGEQYCAYRLIVKTDRGVLVFSGCHDSEGELEVTNE